MKKNILLVQSLLIVPLISSSFIFSMDQKPTYAAVAQKKIGSSTDALKNSGSKKRNKKKNKPRLAADAQQPTITDSIALIAAEARDIAITPEVSTVEVATADKPSIIPSEKQIKDNFSEVLKLILLINKSSSEEQDLDYPNYSPDLIASTYNPVTPVKQGLGWGEWAKRTLSQKWFVLDAINDKTFDPENADHMESLMSTTEQLVLTNQTEQLKDLLEACRKNYPHLEFKRKIALQLQTNFNANENIAAQSLKKDVELADQKLITAYSAMIQRTNQQVALFKQQLENITLDLQKAHNEYNLTINSAVTEQNNKVVDTRNANNLVYKFRRDLEKDQNAQLSYTNPEYLLLKTGVHKQIEAANNNIYESLEQLAMMKKEINDLILPTIAKQSNLLQIENI